MRVMMLHLGVCVSSLVLRSGIAFNTSRTGPEKSKAKYQRVPMHRFVKVEEINGTGACRNWKSHARAGSGR